MPPRGGTDVLWDSETDANWQQAIIKASSRDPAAAAALLAAKPRPPEPTLVTPADVLAAVDDTAPSQSPPPHRRRLHPYDPAKLYSRLAKYYGFSHRELCRMDYRAFFMYVREMHLQLEAERDEIEQQRLARAAGASGSNPSIDPTTQAAHEAQLASQLPAPQPYDGPVVPVASHE